MGTGSGERHLRNRLSGNSRRTHAIYRLGVISGTRCGGKCPRERKRVADRRGVGSPLAPADRCLCNLFGRGLPSGTERRADHARRTRKTGGLARELTRIRACPWEAIVDRRQFAKGALTGSLSLWAARFLAAGRQATNTVRRLTDKISVVDSGGANVVAFNGGEGLVLVDSGVPKGGETLLAALRGIAPNAKVQAVFNTHYHLDQTGNNETFSAAGAKIIAHDRTRQWMSVDTWIPDQDRYEKARPRNAWPTQTFQTTGSLKTGTEQIDYGYLIMAHTSGDIYIHFRDSNVLAAGDVASPQRDPALDYFTGAWIGGRVDAMDTLLKLSNDQTRIIPAYGPVMTRVEL